MNIDVALACIVTQLTGDTRGGGKHVRRKVVGYKERAVPEILEVRCTRDSRGKMEEA